MSYTIHTCNNPDAIYRTRAVHCRTLPYTAVHCRTLPHCAETSPTAGCHTVYILPVRLGVCGMQVIRCVNTCFLLFSFPFPLSPFPFPYSPPPLSTPFLLPTQPSPALASSRQLPDIKLENPVNKKEIPRHHAGVRAVDLPVSVSVQPDRVIRQSVQSKFFSPLKIACGTALCLQLGLRHHRPSVGPRSPDPMFQSGPRVGADARRVTRATIAVPGPQLVCPCHMSLPAAGYFLSLAAREPSTAR